ncbi:MAG: DUF192 domain-containing protein [Alphaproteobacteria bacterium]|nr:DUF192 domain-containing protein [Alphaproteobacteria bacterium]
MGKSAKNSPLIIGVLAVLVLLGAFAAYNGVKAQPVAFDSGNVTIITVRGRFDFSVEIAKTDAQRSQGLQYRREMAADAGMLFDFGRVQDVAMWMKNTFIPLDMVFISQDGRVERVAENTTPQSLEIIQSGNPVLGVLEVVAGTAARLGVTRGSLIVHPMFPGTGKRDK